MTAVTYTQARGYRPDYVPAPEVGDDESSDPTGERLGLRG